MSSRGFIDRARVSSGFREAVALDTATASRQQLTDFILLQKNVMAANEDYLLNLTKHHPEDHALRAGLVLLSRAIEATPQDLVPLQQRVGEWSLDTFGAGRATGTLNHLRREVDELITANQQGTRIHQGEEAADCLILLMNFAAEKGFNLMAEAEKKFAVVQTRTWKPADAEGVIEHEEVSNG